MAVALLFGTVCMLRKTLTTHARIPALFVCSLFGVLVLDRAEAQAPPVVPGAPVAVVAPATLQRLFTEAENAFTAKDYAVAVAKLEELLRALGPNKDAPLELLYFNVGLGNLLGERAAEAEAAFTDCLKRFPKGEYTSRCYLGVGRACIQQDTPEKKERAIDALKLAAQDPKLRSEAGSYLGKVYSDLGRRDEALVVFKSLMGSDIRSPQQTTAAVEVISLLADNGKVEDLIAYLDHLSHQAGVRDAIAWYSNQVTIAGDTLVSTGAYESALAIYRSVPPRRQILETQKSALDSKRKEVKLLEARVNLDKAKALNQRSSASQLLNDLAPAIELSEKALVAIDKQADFDAAVLMRRGICLYYLHRYEEALVCLKVIREKFGSAADAKKAAFSEIRIVAELKDMTQIKELCDKYLVKFPDSENAEQVASLAGEVLIQNKNWVDVGTFYRNLITKFPKSESIDRYTFFQAVSQFEEGNLKEAILAFTQFLKDFPNSPMVENGLYYVAMSYFNTNNYKDTLRISKEYLSKFPDGRFAGDIRYKLAFVDFNDKEADQSDKIIRDLNSFINLHPDDAAIGSMLCLLGDTYKKKTSNKPDEIAKFESQAIESYTRAVWSDSPDDVVQYALDTATSLLQAKKDWAAIAALHGEFLKKKPDSPLALLSAIQVAKMKGREGKGAEAADMLATAIKARIGDPNSEQVEFMIDELVKAIVPRKKPAEIDGEAIDKQLVEILTKVTAGQENPTSNARLYYARAQLARLLKRQDNADRYLKNIATINAKDPSVLSPALLSISGDILLKSGDLEGAEGMYRRLVERYKEGNFADAGPVGLGYIALARKKPDEALKIFEQALETNPGTFRFKESTLGKVQALVELGKLEEAKNIGLQIAGDKMFRGEFAAKAYLLVGQIYRKQAETAVGPEAKIELLKQAHGTYDRVYTSYKSTPEVCAEAGWQAYETLMEMGNKTLAMETLKVLASDPKLKNTTRAKKAAEMSK
jgi:tetratricopeptide (TPR) repeat protein